MQGVDLGSMGFEEIQDWAAREGLPAYRGRQIFRWLHAKAVGNFGEMTELGKSFRARIEELAAPIPVEVVDVIYSEDGTAKYRYRLSDAMEVEGVLMPDQAAGGSRTRTTLCVSTQVGCGMGCSFCATAGMGFLRNLTASEIVGQLEAVMRHLGPAPNRHVTNVVFMGMGEPLANLESVIKAVSILLHPMGHGLSRRRVTISTAGLPPAMEDLVLRVPVKLAVSLNATTDRVRDRIMPVNKRYPLKELLTCCRNLPLSHTDRITFEYVLLEGINDSIDDAERLTVLLRGIRCKVNLIPYNANPGIGFLPSSDEVVEEFKEKLAKASLSVFVRKSRGSGLQGACGQLVIEAKGQKGL